MPSDDLEPLDPLLDEVRACTVCRDHLNHPPRPILQLGSGARLVIIGQAPGRRVHDSGVPWDDPSGDRLRNWLGVTPEVFYDPAQIALLPMGFCFPGTGSHGDLPPRPECAPLWHDRLLMHTDPGALTILLGAYALERYVPERATSLTETVRNWRSFLPSRVVLPHPSPRNNRWLKKNPWFETELLPDLQDRVTDALS